MSGLENAQPGDRLIVTSNHIVATRAIETVERVTDEHIVTDKSRYWKRSGYRVGSKIERGSFGVEPRARLATDGDIKRIEAERARWRMANREFWVDVPDEAVADLYRHAESAKEAKE